MAEFLFGDLFFLRHRLELDHRHVAAGFEGAVLVDHVGDAARHAGGEIAPGHAQHHHDAAGHVFAAMVAGAFDHGDGAGIAHGETLARDAAEIAFALGRAVQHGVADDDRFLRHDAGIGRRPDDDAPARQALADIVVGVAVEFEGDAAREPGAEALPGGAGEAHVDGAVGQAGMAVALGHLAGQHAADGAVDIADDGLQPHRRAAIERGLRFGDQLAVENVVDLVILRLALVDRWCLRAAGGLLNSLEKSRPLAFQCSTSWRWSSICICPTISLNVR